MKKQVDNDTQVTVVVCIYHGYGNPVQPIGRISPYGTKVFNVADDADVRSYPEVPIPLLAVGEVFDVPEGYGAVTIDAAVNTPQGEPDETGGELVAAAGATSESEAPHVISFIPGAYPTFAGPSEDYAIVTEPTVQEAAADPAVLPEVVPEVVPEVPPEVLLGSSVQPALIEVGDRTIQLGELVAAAHVRSGLSVQEWNDLPLNDREFMLADELEIMRKAAAEPAIIAQAVAEVEATIADQPTDDKAP